MRPEPPVLVGLMELAIRPDPLGRFQCGLQGRLLEFRPNGPAESAAIASRLGLEDGSYVVWEVRAEGFPAPISSVRLRRSGSRRGTLCDFPFDASGDDACGHVRMFVNAHNSGLPLQRLWELIEDEPVEVEVVLEGVAEPLGIGPLRDMHLSALPLS